MVTSEVKEIARDASVNPDEAVRVMEALEKRIVKNRRQPAPPPPPGGIGIRAAGKKYKVDFRTISQWAKRGLVKVILETKSIKYIDEQAIAQIAKKYNKNPGRGKRTIYAE
jgi:hypothetical protein